MKKIASLVLAAISYPALTAENAVDRLVNCVDVKDSRDRLACFDREVAPLANARPRPVVPERPQPQVVQSPPIAPAPRTFGEEQLQPKARPAETADDQTLHARIERLRKVTASDFIVYLDNGQAWKHQDVALGEYLREGEAITISRAALGSYRLTRDAGKSKNWIRVTRIR
jgi:hypothetical protein